MPNHCFNRIEIYGEEASKIASKIKSEETPFDFTEIFPEPDYDKIAVKPTFPREKGDDFRMPSWWDWRVQNWGTKWPANCPELTIDDFGGVTYEFDTAWNPPEAICHALRERFPDLNISWFFREDGMEMAGYL